MTRGYLAIYQAILAAILGYTFYHVVVALHNVGAHLHGAGAVIYCKLEHASWIRRMFEEGARLKAERGADKVFDFAQQPRSGAARCSG